jgi:hypothetical protein
MKGKMAGDGMRLTPAKVTDGQGNEITPYIAGLGSPASFNFRHTLRDTGDVTNLTATIALHKNRFFEFTVKPQKAANDQP